MCVDLGRFFSVFLSFVPAPRPTLGSRKRMLTLVIRQLSDSHHPILVRVEVRFPVHAMHGSRSNAEFRGGPRSPGFWEFASCALILYSVYRVALAGVVVTPANVAKPNGTPAS
jgi:hypothetical protein